MILPRRETSFLQHIKCIEKLFSLDRLELGAINAVDKGKIREDLRSKSGLPKCFEFPVFLLFVDSGNWKIRWGMFRYEAIVWFTLTCNTQGMGMSSPDLAQKVGKLQVV